jgi:hypothetical protein
MLVTLVPPTLLLSCLYFLLGHFSKVQCDIFGLDSLLFFELENDK